MNQDYRPFNLPEEEPKKITPEELFWVAVVIVSMIVGLSIK
jgi:hypothetical protein